MRTTLLFLAMFLAGCSDNVMHDNRTDDVPSAPPQVGLASERTGGTGQDFVQTMERITEGWTERQVLKHAGAPNAILNHLYMYSWIEDRYYGGRYHRYVVHLRDHTVVKVEHTTGHETRKPAEQP